MPRLQNKQPDSVRHKPSLGVRGNGRLTTLASLLTVLVVLGLVAVFRQPIYDWWQLRQYQPTANIVKLADDTAMTDYGRKVFYVNHPELHDKASFQQDCPNAAKEQTIILGCYIGGQRGIHLLDVQDPRLNGVEEVTAAHEMLHAAYDRLKPYERRQLDEQLQNYYDNQLKDDRIKKTIDAYRETEPDDLRNEMHSIFGTEIASLPANLEKHYQEYFTDRSRVVGFANQYQAEFTSRQDAVKAADARLDVLKQQIESIQAELKSEQSDIDAEEQRLVGLRNAGNTGAYNQGVAGYNDMVERYNAQVNRLQSLIAEYNALVASRNAAASEVDQLVKDLSSDVEQIEQ